MLCSCSHLQYPQGCKPFEHSLRQGGEAVVIQVSSGVMSTETRRAEQGRDDTFANNQFLIPSRGFRQMMRWPWSRLGTNAMRRPFAVPRSSQN